MRRAVLIGLAFRTLTNRELEASIIATAIAISMKSRRPIMLSSVFSLLTYAIQRLIDPISAFAYSMRVYTLIITLGTALYDVPPEEVLGVSLRLHLPRSLTLISFLTYSYLHRLTQKSIDAKLVVERKFDGLREKLRGRLIGSINSIVEESMSLAELLEAYLKKPFSPPKNYFGELVAMLTTALLAFVPFPLLSTLVPRSSTVIIQDSLILMTHRRVAYS